MSASPLNSVYPASSIKRQRRSKMELAVMRRAMVNTVALQKPMTLRQLFYALTVQGIVDKTEQSYAMVGHQLLKLRREGVIPWADISDNTRWVRRPRTYHGVEHALHLTAETYRRSVFSQVEERVEVWCEKDALAGIIMDVTQVYDVPLYVSRGFASDSYLHEAAEGICADGRPCVIYEFGDHDPSGVAASAATQRKLFTYIDEIAADSGYDENVTFTRMAVTPDQIRILGLPSRPTKREGNSHAIGFEGDSVELDALPPDDLRYLVEASIKRHIPDSMLMALQVAEASERDALRAFARTFDGGRA
ncbi:hypothetical protein [Methylobacterium sp. J-077]|uniref:hypothetical protein n=1 Tax=Methylobacterium sp. J-077 TaxID=2836656 RepID=UPI001FBB062C|nr:hypothetical protein [Methylobacterium sp. J-077]MCJ2126803.1 hypothetical protein [Methylobacterium sp. J-077]